MNSCCNEDGEVFTVCVWLVICLLSWWMMIETLLSRLCECAYGSGVGSLTRNRVPSAWPQVVTSGLY